MAKSYNRNPRKITKAGLTKLKVSLARLGDLSGVVHNIATDEIVGGNQRMSVFGRDPEIIIDHRFDSADEQGTVAIGRIIWEGNAYSYRQVDWDEVTAAEANLAANVAAGAWDADILRSMWNIEEIETVFDTDALSKLRMDWEAMAGVFGIDANLTGIGAEQRGDRGEPDGVEFKEYGEDAADGVEMITCPHCGEKFPK